MTENRFSIELLEIHWNSNLKEVPENDLCAHGQVKVQIGDEIIVDRNQYDGWTVSATALLLLRTLERNHTKENPLEDQLIPCCGHVFIYEGKMSEVYIMGCPNGHDWEVRHTSELIELKTEKGKIVRIKFIHYKNEVLNFVDKVEHFYKISKEKKMPDDESERKAYLKFWEEWNERRDKWK